jgi:prefoldin alpha subunit
MAQEQENMDALVSQLRLLQAQMQEGSRQLEAIEEARAEATDAANALAQLPPKEKLALVPLGSGVYANARFEDPQTVLVDVGGRVIAQKTAEEAKQILAQKSTQLQAASESLKAELNKLATRAGQIQAVLSQAQDR